jgi:quercetin dioxygenase-like cupin family protein
MPGGDGPPTHVHERAAEGFYILEGELELTIHGRTPTAGAGAAVWIPPNTPHSFTIRSSEARVLDLYTPGGFDDRLAFLATHARTRTLPPTGSRIPWITRVGRPTATASATLFCV